MLLKPQSAWCPTPWPQLCVLEREICYPWWMVSSSSLLLVIASRTVYGNCPRPSSLVFFFFRLYGITSLLWAFSMHLETTSYNLFLEALDMLKGDPSFQVKGTNPLPSRLLGTYCVLESELDARVDIDLSGVLYIQWVIVQLGRWSLMTVYSGTPGPAQVSSKPWVVLWDVPCDTSYRFVIWGKSLYLSEPVYLLLKERFKPIPHGHHVGHFLAPLPEHTVLVRRKGEKYFHSMWTV